MLALQNRCLAALPAQVLEGWKPHLSLVELRKGDTLPSIGRFDSLFFPVDCVATIRIRSLDGSSTFMRFSGHEFVIGTAHLIGMGGVRFDVVICGEGHALALPARHLLRLVVRRETVTASCRGWYVAGLIETKRGAIRILQPSGLAAEACACLTLVRRLQGEELQSWRSMGWSSG